MTDGRVRSGHALVVDDEHLMRWFLREALQRKGFEVREAASGREAMLVAQGGMTVDLLLVDRRLPDMDGVDLLARLRALHPLARSVLMTAFVGPEVQAIAQQLGVTRILEKPFGAEDLDAAIAGDGVPGR